MKKLDSRRKVRKFLKKIDPPTRIGKKRKSAQALKMQSAWRSSVGKLLKVEMKKPGGAKHAWKSKAGIAFKKLLKK